jgi:hypothetical protein
MKMLLKFVALMAATLTFIFALCTLETMRLANIVLLFASEACLIYMLSLVLRREEGAEEDVQD